MTDLLKFFHDKRLICQLGGGHPPSNNSSSSLTSITIPDDAQLAIFYQKLIALGLNDELEDRLSSFAEILSKMRKMKISASTEDVSPTEPNRPGVVDLNCLNLRRKDADLTIDRGGRRSITNKHIYRGGNINAMVGIF